MTLRKKYIHLLFLIGLSLHSLPVMSSEFMYGADAEEVVEVSRDISTIIKDNPAYAIAPLAVLLGGAAFLHRKPILDFAKIKYDALANDICDDMINAKQQADNQLNSSVPVAVKVSAKHIFTWALAPVTGTMKKYWEYNRLHIYAATLFSFAGWVGSHPIMGGGLGGITLAAGYLGQAYKMLEELKKQADNNYNALKKQAEENKQQLGLKIENVSVKISKVQEELKSVMNNVQTNLENKINGVQTNLEQQISGVEKNLTATMNVVQKSIEKTLENENEKLSNQMQRNADSLRIEMGDKVEAVGKDINSKIAQSDQKFESQLSALSTKLQELTQECLCLTGQFDKLHEDNVVRDEKSHLLINQLEQANENLLAAKNDFSTLSNTLIGHMTEFTEKTEQQLKHFTDNTADQLGKIESKIETQSQNTEAIKDQVSQLLGRSTTHHELITVLQQLQIEGNQKIINLSGLVQEISSTNSLQLQLCEKIAHQQEESTMNFATKLSSLDKAQDQLQKSFDGFFTKFEKMELEIEKLKREHKIAKKERRELKDMILNLRAESAEALLSLRKHLGEKIDRSAQQVMQHNEESLERNVRKFQRIPTSPQIDSDFVRDSSHVSGSFFPKQKLGFSGHSYDQSFPTTSHQALAGVLGVALRSQAQQSITYR